MADIYFKTRMEARQFAFTGLLQPSIMSRMDSPIQLTEAARIEIRSTLEANKIPDTYGLRVGLRGGACSGSFLLGFDTATEHDQTYLVEGIKVLIDKRHLMYVIGVSVDFEEGVNGSGYTVSTAERVK